MKIVLVMAIVLGAIPLSNDAVADIEDNQIVIENYGTTEAKGFKKKKKAFGFSRTKDRRGSNAGGVIIKCPIGASCDGNRITIRNSGHVYSGKGGTVAGVTLNQ